MRHRGLSFCASFGERCHRSFARRLIVVCRARSGLEHGWGAYCGTMGGAGAGDATPVLKSQIGPLFEVPMGETCERWATQPPMRLRHAHMSKTPTELTIFPLL